MLEAHERGYKDSGIVAPSNFFIKHKPVTQDVAEINEASETASADIIGKMFAEHKDNVKLRLKSQLVELAGQDGLSETAKDRLVNYQPTDQDAMDFVSGYGSSVGQIRGRNE